MSTATLDPIEIEVYRHLFASVAEEMGVRLQRSAFSPNIKERRDYSCAVFDPRGEMIAQAAHIPVHLGSTPASVAAVLDAFPPDAMQPTDAFVVNDPYAGGTHLPDLTTVAPVFVGDTLAFYVCTRAHHADVGGLTPGSMALATHIDDEGLRLPPTRLDDASTQRIADASRTPDERRGDLHAQRAAMHAGAARLVELAQTQSLTTLHRAAAALQDYAARLAADLFRGLPPGVYHATDHLDDDGHGTTDIALRCTLTLTPNGAAFDFTASDDQVAGPVNAVRSIALSAVNYAVRCLAGDALPNNAGVMRPIAVHTRAGSVIDCAHPAPVAGGNVETSQRLVDVVFAALAQAAPDRVPAASQGTMNNLTIGGVFPPNHPRAGEPFTYYETIAGGAGAGPNAPGGDAIHSHMTNTLNTPVEALEQAYPFRIESVRVRDGSGGAGLHSGGHGLVRAYAFDAPATVTLLTERRRHAPPGQAGGQPGAPGRNVLHHPNGTTTQLPAKTSLTVNPGDRLELHTPGGGAWGNA